MNIPETVRIGSVDYEVIESDTPLFLENRQCDGMIDYLKGKIFLDANNLGKQQLELTFLHEIVHGLLHSRGLDEESDEKLVDSLAYVLHQFIRDNPSVFQNI